MRHNRGKPATLDREARVSLQVQQRNTEQIESSGVSRTQTGKSAHVHPF